jgi:hypothetical protein
MDNMTNSRTSEATADLKAPGPHEGYEGYEGYFSRGRVRKNVPKPQSL